MLVAELQYQADLQVRVVDVIRLVAKWCVVLGAIPLTQLALELVNVASIRMWPSLSRHVDRLSRRSARRHDVFDNEHAIARVEREPAPQRERAVLALREDRAHAERAAHLVADDDATERWRQDDGRRKHRDALGQRAREGLRVARVLQYQRALQIPGAVQA